MLIATSVILANSNNSDHIYFLSQAEWSNSRGRVSLLQFHEHKKGDRTAELKRPWPRRRLRFSGFSNVSNQSWVEPRLSLKRRRGSYFSCSRFLTIKKATNSQELVPPFNLMSMPSDLKISWLFCFCYFCRCSLIWLSFCNNTPNPWVDIGHIWQQILMQMPSIEPWLTYSH